MNDQTLREEKTTRGVLGDERSREGKGREGEEEGKGFTGKGREVRLDEGK